MKKTLIFLGIILISISLASGYTVNKARPAVIKNNVSAVIPVKIYTNYQLIDLVKNISCREYGSVGIQGGCAVMQSKFLTLLGVPAPKYSVLPAVVGLSDKRMWSIPVTAGYISFGLEYDIAFMQNNTEMKVNRSVYNELRVYEKKRDII